MQPKKKAKEQAKSSISFPSSSLHIYRINIPKIYINLFEIFVNYLFLLFSFEFKSFHIPSRYNNLLPRFCFSVYFLLLYFLTSQENLAFFFLNLISKWINRRTVFLEDCSSTIQSLILFLLNLIIKNSYKNSS